MSGPVASDGADVASVLAVLRGSRWWVAVIVVICVGLGAGAGYVAPKQYTAQAQLIAGATSVNAAAIPSFAEAGRTLAETYSRVFRADAVQEALVRRFGPEVANDASASPIPDSSVIIVEARGTTPQEAIDVADVAAGALVGTVGGLLDSGRAVETTQGRLGQAFVALNTARAALGSNEEAITPDALRRRAEVQSTQARVDGLIAQLNKLIEDSDQSNGLQPLASAIVTGSNQVQRFELGGLAGLVVGTLVGVAVAYRRRHSRTTRHTMVGRVEPESRTLLEPPGTATQDGGFEREPSEDEGPPTSALESESAADDSSVGEKDVTTVGAADEPSHRTGRARRDELVRLRGYDGLVEGRPVR